MLVALLAIALSGVWLDVPYVHQETNGCGSAVLSMVMQYWAAHGAPLSATDVDMDRIQRELYSPKARGIFASDLVAYLEAHGFRTFTFKAGWADLEEHLSKGRPLIVCLKEPSSLHYVVVAGIEPDNDIVLINDPARRKLMKFHRKDFESTWMGHWTLLAVPKQVN
jgi:predicted double-glycine peptidase